MLTKNEIKRELAELGITKEDTVLLHTSLRALGETEGGANGLIDAFCEYLEDGTLIIPTHTWSNVGRGSPIFDVRSTVPCIGTLPMVAARRTDGVRSLHPTHSVWVHGKSAEELVAGEEKSQTPAPVGGLWWRLHEMGAKILLIGVGNNKNTFIHALDEEADILDRLCDVPYEITVIDYDGGEHKTLFRNHYCSKCPIISEYFINFDRALTEGGAMKIGKLGQAEVRVVDAVLCRKIILGIYRRTEHPENICIAPMDIYGEIAD